MSVPCPQFQELVIAHPWKGWHKVLRHAPKFMRSHPVHSEPHQHFSPNTITIVCGKKQTQSLQHSALLMPFQNALSLGCPQRHATPFCWWSPSGSCFCQRLNLSISHLLPTKLMETVSLNCVWLLQVISLKPSAGLLGPGDFFGSFLHLASSVCRLKCVFYEDGWSTLSIGRYLLNFMCQWDAEQIQLSTHNLNFILEALV